jgi:hypothetical protein
MKKELKKILQENERFISERIEKTLKVIETLKKNKNG